MVTYARAERPKSVSRSLIEFIPITKECRLTIVVSGIRLERWLQKSLYLHRKMSNLPFYRKTTKARACGPSFQWLMLIAQIFSG
jgi:hypothetical protein